MALILRNRATVINFKHILWKSSSASHICILKSYNSVSIPLLADVQVRFQHAKEDKIAHTAEVDKTIVQHYKKLYQILDDVISDHRQVNGNTKLKDIKHKQSVSSSYENKRPYSQIQIQSAHKTEASTLHGKEDSSESTALFHTPAYTQRITPSGLLPAERNHALGVDESTFIENEYSHSKDDADLADMQAEAPSGNRLKFDKEFMAIKELRPAVVNSRLKQAHQERRALKQYKDAKRTLIMYIDACFEANMDTRATSLVGSLYLNALNTMRHKNKKTYSKPDGKKRDSAVYSEALDVEVLNCLIHNQAKKGHLESIQKQFTKMENINIKPNMDSYVGLIECLARIGSPPIIQRVLLDTKVLGWSIEDVMYKVNKIDLEDKKRQNLEKIVRMLFPDFTPKTIESSEDYKPCNLLKNFSDDGLPNPSYGVLSADELKARARAQMDIDKESHISVPNICVLDAKRDYTKLRKLLEDQIRIWRVDVRAGFSTELNSLEHAARYSQVPNELPFLKLLDPEEYVNLILNEIEVQSEPFNWKSNSFLARELGASVWKKIQVQRLQKDGSMKKVGEVYEEYASKLSQPKCATNHRKMFTSLLHEKGCENVLEMAPNPSDYLMKKIGDFLLKILLSYVKINVHMLDPKKKAVFSPAFYYRVEEYEMRIITLMKAHPLLVHLHESAATYTKIRYDKFPLVAPPVPWCHPKYGIHTHASDYLIRLQEVHEVDDYLAMTNINPVLDSLNAVSSCPWIMNKKILNEQIRIFKKGGDKEVNIERPKTAIVLPTVPKGASPQEKARVAADRRPLLKQMGELHSLWTSNLYRLSIANKFKDDIFYFGNTLDFRGRAYPTSAYFSHLGADNTRGTLLFAKGKPLGPKGLDWLKIHLINTSGLKKRSSNQERLEYANEILDDIIDSADRPFKGKGWWKECDDIWQALATSHEIAAAVRSPDPEQYVSHLPVHQDGSCNGLQHYAALGRDQIGAESVNLYPFDTPSDVYSDVVRLVEEQRAKDAAEGLEIAQVLEGHVTRKVVKQTVMTKVYGVTGYGARLQVQRKLKDIEDFPEEHLHLAGLYLADKIMDSINLMFESARSIQDWLVWSADIAQRQGKNVEWTTPLDFPVYQFYVKTVGTSTKRLYTKPNATKQKNGLAPNFIHALDATHMLLTASHCQKEGVTFASVHDCFWTHACDVDAMNKICREQFVALHNEPILEDLAENFHKRYGLEISDRDSAKVKALKTKINDTLKTTPRKGKFKLENVLKSTYFFS